MTAEGCGHYGGNDMIHDALTVAAAILKAAVLPAVGGLLAIQVAAWIWYRRDGGKLGLIAWLRGI